MGGLMGAMADFHQNGIITTLHRLGVPDRPRLEAELLRFSQRRPLALILPALASEMDGPALGPILNELKGAEYINEIVVTLGKAGKKEFSRAREYFKVLKRPLTIVWNDGRRVQKLLAELGEGGINIGQDGKGRSVWLALGLILARGQSRVVALHDCDILEYNRELLGRLAYPLMSPHLAYEFCKGYYARVTHRMYGRVTRLFVRPLILALQAGLGPLPYLAFMGSFRYALAGECAMDMELARMNRIPGDWGLEVGVLGEVYRNTSPRRVCQVDLVDTYEHKHQELSSEDPNKGLAKMSTDIARTMLRALASEGAELSRGLLRALEVSYLRRAEDMIATYAADAAVNGLSFDRHAEGLAVETFAQGLNRAIQQFEADSRGQSVISNWNRVISAFPDFLERLVDAVEADNR
jgi:glucosyl-3-phosphoglycerate synthase